MALVLSLEKIQGHFYYTNFLHSLILFLWFRALSPIIRSKKCMKKNRTQKVLFCYDILATRWSS